MRRGTSSSIQFGLTIASLTAASVQAIPAFPGAEGFGAAVTGGRNGDVYHVTSLADTNTPGTLRYGVNNTPAAGRTIVFDLSGMITLGSNLGINKNNLTIAGQTAPGEGITIRGWESAVGNVQATPSNNVIVRYMHFRPGDISGPKNKASPNFQGDSIHVRYAKNVIFDHLSTSWSIDETMSASSCDNVSLQHSIIGEALRTAGHDDGAGGTENHGYGMLLGTTDATYGGKISIHHNFFTSNDSRNPRVGNDNRIDFVNNILYNWGGRCGYSGGAAEGTPQINYIGNYLIAGPSTTSGHAAEAFYGGSTNTQIYQSDNLIDPNKNSTRDGTNTGTTMFTIAGGQQTFVASPFAFGNVTATAASANYAKVLDRVGASIVRDATDTRMINNLINTTGAFINSQDDVGGYPTIPTLTRAAGYDTDNDGIPDTWEAAVGTNPNVANNNGDFDSDGYTDLEDYLNDVGAFPAPAPISWNGSTSRYALSTNWNLNNWQPSRYDTVNISSGTATVDAPDQHAGTLNVIGGTISFTSGWMDVVNQLQIGGSIGAGTASQTGGIVMAGNVKLGDGTGTSGTYLLTSGTLVTGAISSGTAGGNLHLNGGTIQPTGSTTAFIPAGTTVKVQSGGAKFDTAGFNITVAVPLIGDILPGADGGLTKNGAGTLTLSGVNTYNGPTTVNAGKVLFSQGLKSGGNVTLSSGTVLEVAANGSSSGVSKIKSLSLSTSGSNYSSKLELHDNDLILDYTGGASVYSTTVNQVKKGLTLLGGDGMGIASDRVDAQTLNGTVLAVVDNGAIDGDIGALSGYPAPHDSVLVKYTWFGDATLDGIVDGADYALIDTGFTSGGALTGWIFGDFNYDGAVTGEDYALIDTGFIAQTGALPEPAILGIIGIGVLGLGRRRK